MALLRSIVTKAAAAASRSSRFSAVASPHVLRRFHHVAASRPFSSTLANPNPNPRPFDTRSPFAMGIGNARSFSQDVAPMPVIEDPEIHIVFKDLMAANWDEIPYDISQRAKKALSKNANDTAGKEVLTNVFRAAEAVEEFSGMVMNLKMDLDDAIGSSGEDVKPLPDDFAKALRTVFDRYTAYLGSFGPDEGYLQKKVETELGSKMIYLKMRCSGLGAEWVKVTVLGTSGIAGSYIEQRA